MCGLQLRSFWKTSGRRTCFLLQRRRIGRQVESEHQSWRWGQCTNTYCKRKNLPDIPKKGVCRRNSTSTLLNDEGVDIPLVKRNVACAKVFSVESPHTYPEVKWTPALKGKNFNTLKGYYYHQKGLF